jgi:N-carbamoylputrescine amidase
MHIPDDPLYYEKFYFTPGDLGFRSFATKRAKVGTLVCWDQWFPEGARLTALAGAEVLFYPTAIGWLDGEAADVNEGQRDAWETSQRAHAIANGVFVAAVNRVGREGDLTFWGNSFVADPFGRVIARASTDREETLIVPCDLGRIDVVRTNWPFLRDRRIDAYAGITRRLLDEPS